MRIESIEAVNLKVPSFHHDIGAVTIFCGNNYAGKSARLEAIRLGLLGWCPGLPKTNAGIFSLSCGAEMGVTLRLSDGITVTRHYSQKGESVKAIEMANGFEVPPVLLDASEYLRLSDRERVKYVFGLVDIADKWSGETILRAIGETPIDCSPEIVEAVVLAKREIFQWLSKSDHIRHDEDQSVQDWLESILDDLRERIRNTNAALGRMEKYSQASIELRANGNGLDAANVDRALKEKAGHLQALREKQAVNKQLSNEARRNEVTRNELTRCLAEPFDVATLDAFRKQIIDLGSKKHKSLTGGLADKVAEAKGHLEAARAMDLKIESEIIAINCQHELDLIAPACPHCGTKGKKFKDAIEERFLERIDGLVKNQRKTIEEIRLAFTAYNEASNAYEVSTSEDRKAQQNAMILQSAKAELNRLETLSRNRELWQQQLDNLKAVEAPTDQDTFELSKEIARIETEVGDLTDRQKRWIAAAQDAKRMAEAKARRTKDEAELLALKAVVKSVEVITAEIVAEAFAKILSDANRFTDGILLTPLSYHNGEIGRWSGITKNWITCKHKIFSGAEEVISCAGISVALARQSPIRIVLLDEFGNLKAALKRTMIERLMALVAEDFISQAIIVDVDARPYRDIEVVRVIEI